MSLGQSIYFVASSRCFTQISLANPRIGLEHKEKGHQGCPLLNDVEWASLMPVTFRRASLMPLVLVLQTDPGVRQWYLGRIYHSPRSRYFAAAQYDDPKPVPSNGIWNRPRLPRETHCILADSVAR